MKTIFIAGTPGVGKTCFGDWLRDTKGYIHVDMEKFSDSGLQKKWDKCFKSKDIRPFVNEIMKMNRPVVMTWGFPPDHLSIIYQFRDLGIECIWFDAPEMLARDSFLHRNTVSEAEFDSQMGAIRKHQKDLLAFFDDKTVTVMLGKRVYRNRDDIFSQIQSGEA